jgi:DNA adenine methylase
LGQYIGVEKSLPTNPIPFTPLKWVGAKTPLFFWMAKYLQKGEHYYEPFIGGGSVFYYMFRHKLLPKGNIQISDLNPRLINFYRVLRDHPYIFIDHMEGYKGCNNKKFYQSVQHKTYEDPVKDAGLFLYLNKTAWRGMYAENKDGKMAIGFGFRPKVKFVEHKKILSASAALQDVTILNMRWETALKDVPKGSFVYLDPPYYEMYTEYTQHGFNIRDQILLRDWCNDHKKDLKILESNADIEEVRELYEGWKFSSQDILYKVNFKEKKELIIYNYDMK